MTDLGELRLGDYWRAAIDRGVVRGYRAAADKREAGAEGSRTRPGKASRVEATAPTQQKG